MNALPFQFTTKRLLWAIVWVGIGLALWRATAPLDWQHLVDDDPDNIRHRLLATLYAVPLVGAFGALRGRPVRDASKAFGIWLALGALIFAVGFFRLF